MPQPGNTFLACKIAKGLFEDERIVEFTVGEITYQTIADREDVKENKALQEDGWAEGLLRVHVVSKGEEKVLVNLPREAAGNGRRLSVPRDLLKGT